jgi:hypothetical protein
VKHRASPEFWALYRALPKTVQAIADKNFERLKDSPRHPSLHFKRIGELWSARVGEHYRALGIDGRPDGVYWFWIGPHALYDRLIRQA